MFFEYVLFCIKSVYIGVKFFLIFCEFINNSKVIYIMMI